MIILSLYLGFVQKVCRIITKVWVCREMAVILQRQTIKNKQKH
jgi:hypothetical protein